MEETRTFDELNVETGTGEATVTKLMTVVDSLSDSDIMKYPSESGEPVERGAVGREVRPALKRRMDDGISIVLSK